MYTQEDGCPMGGCISPTLANSFLCHFETKWLQDCPVQFKPALYRRYVDDTFLLFRDQSHVKLFFDYINIQHDRIKFTFDLEKDISISFLDVLINKTDTAFQTSTYRKPSSTGLGLKFDSAVSSKYKFNLVDCLIDRAYKINSSYSNLCTEFDNLRRFFSQNGFSISMIDKCIYKKLDSIYKPISTISTVPKQIIYCKVPFMSNFFNKHLNSEVIK